MTRFLRTTKTRVRHCVSSSIHCKAINQWSRSDEKKKKVTSLIQSCTATKRKKNAWYMQRHAPLMREIRFMLKKGMKSTQCKGWREREKRILGGKSETETRKTLYLPHVWWYQSLHAACASCLPAHSTFACIVAPAHACVRRRAGGKQTKRKRGKRGKTQRLNTRIQSNALHEACTGRAVDTGRGWRGFLV